MKWDSPEAGEQELDEEDEWQLYASAGYASAEVIVEADETEEEEEEIWFDGDDLELNGASIDWDAPPCPAPLGIAHIIKIGACNHCLHRLAGRRTEVPGAPGGEEIRSAAHVRDTELAKTKTPDLCPLCENLFDDVGNIVSRVIESTEGIEYVSIQFGIHMPKDLIQEEDR
ncbi:uncharacterized protein METZ01_LOCUS375882, partial [marine metagenome]